MLRIILIALFATVLTFANNEFSILYKIDKGGKKLGYYEVNLGSSNVSSNSYGASNRLEMFSTKNIDYIENGYKKITFSKNNKSYNFNVITKLSVIDQDIRKKYNRKFKKVKGDDMLFITKDAKNGIELFNKRATIVKTIDEFLSDIYHQKLDYDKFILFDKLGVMKMVAKVVKEPNAIIIENSSKKKEYMKITLKGNEPISIKSMLSNWSATAVASGKYKKYEVDLAKIVAKRYSSKLKGSNIEFSKIKKSGKYYNLNGTISFALSPKLLDEKSYKQNAYCKSELKKAKIKHKKINISNSQCVADIKMKSKIKDLKRDILDELVKEHEQLKVTKKIKFQDDKIIYEVL
ncbi:MAG: hypothetical protein OQK11_00385 [Thiovulaceae bacterium]|nr:hypothetical protein [Sulfurimonadaceae bacterium]